MVRLNIGKICRRLLFSSVGIFTCAGHYINVVIISLWCGFRLGYGGFGVLSPAVLHKIADRNFMEASPPAHAPYPYAKQDCAA